MREFLQYLSVKAYSLPQSFEFYLKKKERNDANVWQQAETELD